jgi:hypothetical protein
MNRLKGPSCSAHWPCSWHGQDWTSCSLVCVQWSCLCPELDRTAKNIEVPCYFFSCTKIIPQCAVGDKCICPNAPLEGRHFCAICKKPLHGPCGVFNGDDSSLTYHNRCFNCSFATAVASSTSNEQVGTTTPCTTPSATQQSTPVTAKDIDPKAVTWSDITVDDRPSM